MAQPYYVYIMASRSRVLYIGVTRDLERRMREHRAPEIGGFSREYYTRKLVYWEQYAEVEEAIAREKQLKRWRREKKVGLVEGANSSWRDLARDWV